jgi:cytochrome P450
LRGPSAREEEQVTSTSDDLDQVLVIDREHWADGPPHELFARLRGECPVHWTARVPEYPDEAGYWSITRPDDIHTVSRDWRTFSSATGITAVSDLFMELMQAMFIGMDPPKHDRLKMLFQAGFTPKRIAAHEDEIRAIAVGVLDGLQGRDSCDLVADVAQPIVSRVIGSFMGIPESDDAIWAKLMNVSLSAGDSDLAPEGIESILANEIPEIFRRCSEMIAARRENPTDDLTSVLVNAEIDGQKLEEHEIVMGFFLLVAAGNDSTKATYCSGMRALMDDPDERAILLEDPSLIPSAVEESLRMFPAFAHFRRTATCDTEVAGQQIREGDKVVMYFGAANRDPAAFDRPETLDLSRPDNPHIAFGTGPHGCLGQHIARIEIDAMLVEVLTRMTGFELAAPTEWLPSNFISGPKAMPLRFTPTR